MAEMSYIIKSKYSSSLDSLKNSSYDKENRVYMCQSDMQVVDFDALTFTLYPTKQPASYDALLIEEDIKDIFCVEFKNQKTSDIDNTQLHKKVKDSDSTLKKLCSENSINKNDYNYKLCIVYKQETTKPRYRRFKENIIHFGLDVYSGVYFDEIITNEIGFFQNEFKKKYGC